MSNTVMNDSLFLNKQTNAKHLTPTTLQVHHNVTKTIRSDHLLQKFPILARRMLAYGNFRIKQLNERKIEYCLKH